MKKFLFLLTVVVALSCKKSNENRTCWDCEVIRMDGTKYKDRTCVEGGGGPQYTDANGNDLQAFCTRR